MTDVTILFSVSDQISSFTDLKTWQHSHKLVVRVFEVFQESPKSTVLKQQIERSSLSITSNIAEGFGRQTMADKRHFYIVARGSAYEVQNQLVLGRDIKAISDKNFQELADLSLNSIKLIHGLIRSLKKDANS